MDRDLPVPAGIALHTPVADDGTDGIKELRQGPAGRAADSLPAPLPVPLEVSSTYLAPADAFPTALAELGLAELHVLHSRITRQLEHEHIDPAGPHPVTLDRAQELVEELDTRQGFLTATASATPAGLRAVLPPAAPGTDTGHTQASSSRPGPAAEPHAAADATGQSPPTSPHRDEKHPSRVPPIRADGPEAEVRIHDLGQLRPGDRIQVWHRGLLQCVGTVEETAPSLGVVWIREGLDAYRRMIHAQENELRSLRVRGGG
jgi:hypothetical protein